MEQIECAWPPTEDPPASGYQRTSLEATRPVAATALPPVAGHGLAVVLAEADAGALTIAPLVRDGTGWRRARPRDGAATALVAAIAADATFEDGFEGHRLAPLAAARGEHAIGVEQTNESVVVGGSVVVKWLTEPSLRPAGLPDVHAHLAALGFQGIPRPLGSLVWVGPSGDRASVAFLNTFLPDALDGWDWCVQDLLVHLAHDPDACPADCVALRDPAELGSLAASLHLALATPSPVIREPRSTAGAAAVRRWTDDAERALDTALVLLTGAHLTIIQDRADRLRADIRTLASVGPVDVQPIHGDLHVGQVLRSSAGLRVIDLDDDISIDVADRGRPLPTARDLAQLTCSLDHVGRIAARRVGPEQLPRIEDWIDVAQATLLDGYLATLAEAGEPDLLDARLLRPFVAERICRELVYAAQVLPRWLHAPLGTLQREYPEAG